MHAHYTTIAEVSNAVQRPILGTSSVIGPLPFKKIFIFHRNAMMKHIGTYLRKIRAILTCENDIETFSRLKKVVINQGSVRS